MKRNLKGSFSARFIQGAEGTCQIVFSGRRTQSAQTRRGSLGGLKAKLHMRERRRAGEPVGAGVRERRLDAALL